MSGVDLVWLTSLVGGVIFVALGYSLRGLRAPAPAAQGLVAPGAPAPAPELARLRAERSALARELAQDRETLGRVERALAEERERRAVELEAERSAEEDAARDLLAAEAAREALEQETAAAKAAAAEAEAALGAEREARLQLEQTLVAEQIRSAALIEELESTAADPQMKALAAALESLETGMHAVLREVAEQGDQQRKAFAELGSAWDALRTARKEHRAVTSRPGGVLGASPSRTSTAREHDKQTLPPPGSARRGGTQPLYDPARDIESLREARRELVALREEHRLLREAHDLLRSQLEGYRDVLAEPDDIELRVEQLLERAQVFEVSRQQQEQGALEALSGLHRLDALRPPAQLFGEGPGATLIARLCTDLALDAVVVADAMGQPVGGAGTTERHAGMAALAAMASQLAGLASQFLHLAEVRQVRLQDSLGVSLHWQLFGLEGQELALACLGTDASTADAARIVETAAVLESALALRHSAPSLPLSTAR